MAVEPKEYDKFSDLLADIQLLKTDEQKFELASKHMNLVKNLWDLASVFDQISSILQRNNVNRAQALLDQYVKINYKNISSKTAINDFVFQSGYRLSDYFASATKAAERALENSAPKQTSKSSVKEEPPVRRIKPA